MVKLSYYNRRKHDEYNTFFWGEGDDGLQSLCMDDCAYFQKKIVAWYKLYGRSFPWRETRDPYLILIAEIMLQRTRAEQVLPVYKNFVYEYPNIFKLAGADSAEIKKHFDTLGLHKRSDFLVRLCNELVSSFNGNIPADYDVLKNLPCVGQYTANAILSFGYNKPLPIVDSNVVRILNRYFKLNYSNHKPNKGIMILAEILVDKQNIREYNYGILDLSSSVCGATQNPLCEECPLLPRCLSKLGADQ